MRRPDAKVTLICTKTCHKDRCQHAEPHERHTAWSHQSDCWRSSCQRGGGICVPLDFVWVYDETELP